jgi:hypothetical protein
LPSAELPLGVHTDLDLKAFRTDDCDVQGEAELAQAASLSRRSPVLWWQLVLVACAVIVALSSLVVARSEMRQADYLRKANCAARAQAGGTEAKNQGDIQDDAIRAELRRCLGLPKQP